MAAGTVPRARRPAGGRRPTTRVFNGSPTFRPSLRVFAVQRAVLCCQAGAWE